MENASNKKPRREISNICSALTIKPYLCRTKLYFLLSREMPRNAFVAPHGKGYFIIFQKLERYFFFLLELLNSVVRRLKGHLEVIKSNYFLEQASYPINQWALKNSVDFEDLKFSGQVSKNAKNNLKNEKVLESSNQTTQKVHVNTSMIF